MKTRDIQQANEPELNLACDSSMQKQVQKKTGMAAAVVLQILDSERSHPSQLLC
jgi:hypothetical protein